MLFGYTEEFTVEQILNGEVPREILLSIRPERIVDWFHLKAYGKKKVGSDDRPVEFRSSTLGSYKKGLSHFMPRQMSPWDPVNEYGNPTRSEILNALVSMVKNRSKATRSRNKSTQTIGIQKIRKYIESNKEKRTRINQS